MNEVNLRSVLVGALSQEKLRAESDYRNAWQELTELRCRIHQLQRTLEALQESQQSAFADRRDILARGYRREAQGISLMLRKHQAQLAGAKQTLCETELRLAELLSRLETLQGIQSIETTISAPAEVPETNVAEDSHYETYQPATKQLT